MAEKKTESLFLNRLEECKYPKADIGKEDVKVWSQTEFKGEDNYLESAFKHASKRKGKNGEGKPELKKYALFKYMSEKGMIGGGEDEEN